MWSPRRAQPADQRPEEVPPEPAAAGQRGLEGRLRRVGKQTPLLEGAHGDPRPERELIRAWGRPGCSSWGLLGEGAGAGSSQRLHWGQTSQGQMHWGSIHSHALLFEGWRRSGGTRAGLGLQPVGSRARTPEAKWPPGQGHGPALQQTGCLPKSPLNTAGLAHQKAGTRLHPSWAGTGPSPRKPAGSSRPASPTRGQTPEEGKPWSAARRPSPPAQARHSPRPAGPGPQQMNGGTWLGHRASPTDGHCPGAGG